MMSRLACGNHAFTEHRYSKSPDLCTLNNPYGTNDNLNFIRDFASSQRDWRTGLDTSGLTVCMFYRLPPGKKCFSLITEMVVRSTMKVMTMRGS